MVQPLFVALTCYSMERIPHPFLTQVCLHQMEGARPSMQLLMDTFVQRAVISWYFTTFIMLMQ